MAEAINGTSLFIESYELFKSFFPANLEIFPPLFLFTFLIALYAIFVWVFYRFIAQRDLLSLNLKRYNALEHSGAVKLLAIVLYTLEFIIILPFLVIFWFAVFASLMIVLSAGHSIQTILLISASIVAGIRLTSYYKEDLARDLAKMIPFTFLGVALLTPGFFNLSSTLSKLSEIPLLFHSLIYYALFIIFIEVILRLIYLSVTYKKTEKEAKNES